MAETRTARSTTPWFGWVTFAAVTLAVLGLLNILEGLVALLRRQVTFIDGDSLVVVDLTGLGVVLLVFGVLLLIAGIGLMARNTVARIAAIVIVSLHLLSQVGTLGAYPIWSLLMIALDVILLFALTVHWPGALEPEAAQPPMHGTHRADRDLQQSRPGGFPVNAPTSTGRGAHAPGPQQQQPPVDPRQAGPHMAPPPGYQQQGPQYQAQQPAGPYPPPNRPSSPAHAAPTSGPSGGSSGPSGPSGPPSSYPTSDPNPG